MGPGAVWELKNRFLLTPLRWRSGYELLVGTYIYMTLGISLIPNITFSFLKINRYVWVKSSRKTLYVGTYSWRNKTFSYYFCQLRTFSDFKGSTASEFEHLNIIKFYPKSLQKKNHLCYSSLPCSYLSINLPLLFFMETKNMFIIIEYLMALAKWCVGIHAQYLPPFWHLTLK